jgi:outer membrane protein OmpA-like peptidoglycan-associated protein
VAANTAKETAVEASNRANRVNTRVDNLVENIDAFTLSRTVTVNFRLNRSTLDEAARAELDALSAELQGKKGYVIEIQGFTDSTGSDARNRLLSQRRAQSVFQYLAEVHNLPIFRMHILGLGEGRPVAENRTRDGRAQNRRVEVRLLTTELQD